MTFHELCSWRIRQASSAQRDLLSEVQRDYPNHNRFDVHMPCALALSSEILDDRFDAVVVDEGQDFKDTYWLALTYLLSDEEKSPFFVFLDSNQSIYSNEIEDIPVKESPFYLTFNCRNTKYIHDSAYRFFEGEGVDPPSENPGTPIKTIESELQSTQAGMIRDEIGKLLDDQGIEENQVAVLIGGTNKDAFYSELEDTHLPSGHQWNIEGSAESTGVRVDTVKRFKGLEADIVYLWELKI